MTRMPGTMIGLVEYGEQTAQLLQEQDDALVELLGLLSRAERTMDAESVLRRDVQVTLRFVDGLRSRVRPLIAQRE